MKVLLFGSQYHLSSGNRPPEHSGALTWKKVKVISFLCGRALWTHRLCAVGYLRAAAASLVLQAG